MLSHLLPNIRQGKGEEGTYWINDGMLKPITSIILDHRCTDMSESEELFSPFLKKIRTN
jgi:hypothetical protein